MRRFIVSLIITGTVWAQTGLDKLVLDDRTEFLGEYSGVMENLVYFKPAKALAFQGVPINRIRSLQLRDGKTIIEDEYIKIRTILDYKHLSIKDKAIYDDGRDSKLTGEEAYALYASEVKNLIKKYGGEFLFISKVSRMMCGEVEDLWDTGAIAKYPDRNSLYKMIMDPEYQKIHIHRDAGLEGQLNIETINND